MAQPVERKKGGHLITRLLAILLSAILITCLIIPIQQARINTQREFRDAYVYQAQAKRYFLAIHSANVNLDALCGKLLSIPADTKQMSTASFALLSQSKELLDAQDTLMLLVRRQMYDLQQLSDPGNGDMVRAVNDYYDACRVLYAHVRSGQYDAPTYRKKLRELQEEAHSCQTHLHSLINDL